MIAAKPREQMSREELYAEIDMLRAMHTLESPGHSAEEIAGASRYFENSSYGKFGNAGHYADGFAHAISEIGKIMGGEDDGSGTWTEPFETVRRKVLGFYHHALRMAWCKFEMRCKLREARDYINDTPAVSTAVYGAKALVAEIDALLDSHKEFPRIGSANSILFQALNPEGKIVSHGSLSTLNADRDLSVMLAALELTQAVRRGVAIDPAVFFERITSKR